MWVCVVYVCRLFKYICILVHVSECSHQGQRITSGVLSFPASFSWTGPIVESGAADSQQVPENLLSPLPRHARAIGAGMSRPKFSVNAEELNSSGPQACLCSRHSYPLKPSLQPWKANDTCVCVGVGVWTVALYTFMQWREHFHVFLDTQILALFYLCSCNTI